MLGCLRDPMHTCRRQRLRYFARAFASSIAKDNAVNPIVVLIRIARHGNAEIQMSTNTRKTLVPLVVFVNVSLVS